MASWRTKAGGRGFALGSHARSMRGRGPCGCSCQERCSQRPVCPTPRAQQSQGSPPPPPPRRQRPRSRLLNDGFRETPGKGASCAHRGRPGSAALRGRMNAIAKGRGATPTSPRLCFQTIDFLEPPGSRLPCAPPSRQVRRRAEPPVSWPRRSSARTRTSTRTRTSLLCARVPAVRTHLGLLHPLHSPWGSQGARLRQPASPRSPRYEASGRTAEPRAPQRWLH